MEKDVLLVASVCGLIGCGKDSVSDVKIDYGDSSCLLFRQTLNAIWIITNGNCFHGDIARSRIITLKSDFKKESVRERINLDFPCKRIRSTGFRTGFMDIGHRQLQEISGNGSRTVGNPYPCRCS